MSRNAAGGRPEAPRATWWQRAWQPFWALPGVIAVGSVVLGVVLPQLDAAVTEPWGWVFEGGVDGARSVLGGIAGAMISVTGLVFSITMVVLQLASTQYTPRVLGDFLQSRITQTTLGVFAGSFLYALTVLRKVGAGADDQVPQLSVTVAYLYVLVAVGMFLAFIHHITVSVQVARVLAALRRQTTANVAALHVARGQDARGASWSPRPGTPRVLLRLTGRGGYVTVLDSSRLTACARELDVVVALDLGPGDHVIDGQVVGRAWGKASLHDDDVRELLSALHLGKSRTSHHDTGFGVRQLLDIAERALSPGINDPTTAIEALHALHAVLREVVARPDPTPYLTDDEGVVRARYRPRTYAQLLAAVVEEIVHYGRDSLRLVPGLRDVLEDLLDAARPEHRAVTEAALEAVDAFLVEEGRPSLLRHVEGRARRPT